MSDPTKIIRFNRDNIKGLMNIHNISKNSLIRDLIYIAALYRQTTREFDCSTNNVAFHNTWYRLSRYCQGLQKDLMYSKNSNPELDKWIVSINSTLESLMFEIKKNYPNPNNIVTLLTRLAKQAYDIEDKYDIVLEPSGGFWKGLRESKLVKWTGIGLIALGTLFHFHNKYDTSKRAEQTEMETIKKAEEEEKRMTIDMDRSESELFAMLKNMKAEQREKLFLESLTDKDREVLKNLRNMSDGERRRAGMWNKDYANKIYYKFVVISIARKAMINKVYSLLLSKEMPVDFMTRRDVMAIIWQESGFDPNAFNGSARGLGQVVGGSLNIERNINQILEKFKEKEIACITYCPNWDKLSRDVKRRIIFQTYNSGEGNMMNYNWNALNSTNPEKRDYIKFIYEYLHLMESWIQ